MRFTSARMLLAGLAAACLGACQAVDASGEVRGWVWSYDEATREYATKIESVPRLESLRHLRGTFFDFRRSARFSVAVGGDGAVAQDIDPGRSFELEYGLDEAGVVVAG